jgi:hypothetical protein
MGSARGFSTFLLKLSALVRTLLRNIKKIRTSIYSVGLAGQLSFERIIRLFINTSIETSESYNEIVLEFFY